MHLVAREGVSNLFQRPYAWLVQQHKNWPSKMTETSRHTFRVDPVRIAIGQSSTVTELLDRLRGFVVDLEERTRPSPTGLVLLFRHFVHTSPTRLICARVVGDGTLEEEWGRQFAGFVWNRGKRVVGVQPGGRRGSGDRGRSSGGDPNSW